jgi:hypothetical protein
MKRTISLLCLLLASTTLLSQSNFKEQKVGHIFYINLPEYMTKTIGLNSSASIQFKNTVKDVAGFVIEDNKEELRLAELNYSSLNEFYEDFIKNFLEGEDKRAISPPKLNKIGKVSFIESDASYYDKESNLEIYYLVGIAETESAYYKFLCWTSLGNKDKFKADFQKSLYSIKD